MGLLHTLVVVNTMDLYRDHANCKSMVMQKEMTLRLSSNLYILYQTAWLRLAMIPTYCLVSWSCAHTCLYCCRQGKWHYLIKDCCPHTDPNKCCHNTCPQPICFIQTRDHRAWTTNSFCNCDYRSVHEVKILKLWGRPGVGKSSIFSENILS